MAYDLRKGSVYENRAADAGEQLLRVSIGGAARKNALGKVKHRYTETELGRSTAGKVGNSHQ